MGYRISGTATDVTLELTGDAPAAVRFDLPAFRGRACTASAGIVHRDEGWVELAKGATQTTVALRDSCQAAAPDAGGSTPDDGGCGCSLAPGRVPRAASGVFFLALLILLRRRR